MIARRIRGVVAAVPTPVDPSGEPDTNRFVRHARWALDNGCDGLNVLGTTGEANSLSPDQRGTVMAEAASALDKNRLMVGTGTPDIKTTIALTRLAHELGFAAALVLPPYYYKSVSDDGLFAWFGALIAATGDTPIPIYAYNFPQMTGLTFSPDVLQRLVTKFPERIYGAKDSSGNLEYAAQIAAIEGLDVFPSNEAALARVDADGYAGCISASVNITAPLAARLWANRTDPDLLKTVAGARVAIAAQPLIPAVKYLVSRLHHDAEFERLLPPHLPLTDAQKSALPDMRAITGAV